jgi:hypothetical protein
MWDSFIARLKTEPTILVQAAQAVLGALVAFGVVGFTDSQTGAVLAVVSAVSGFLLALGVRPFNWAVLTGVVQAIILLAVEFGLNWSDTQVAATFMVISMASMFMRQLVTPETKLPAIAVG